MRFLKFNPKKSKAQAMVEFAIVLPILLLVVYGLIEVGRLIFIVASVNNASRQAVRYGSTSGVGPNGVPRYQDCSGIRAAAQNSDFLNVFEDADIEITYDNPDNVISYDATCDGATDTSVTPSTGDRVNVKIDANFNAILPKFLPFLSRPVISESARTLLLTINIEPPKEPTTVVITTDNPDPSEVGQLVLVTVIVNATTTPTGEVYITGADQNCTITLSGGTGSCNVRFLTAGSKTIIASYVGDIDHEASITDPGEPHDVSPASTITTITADTPDPSLADPNQLINVSVTVTSAYGVPTGTVDITGAGTNCIITLTGGAGNCNVKFSSVGVYTLTATYSGSTDHKSSSDTEIHNVTPPGATFTVITGDSPDPSVVGQTVTVSVAVTGITTPTGTVVITGADTNCTITLSGGTGSCNVVFNSTGNKILVATYNPDSPAHTGSSDTENHAVSLPFTTTTITADSPDPSAVGQSVNVTVAVTGGSTTPTGTVTISGADVNCTITLSGGTGSCAVIFNSAGDKTLTATYNGDGSHAGSNDIESHTVSGTTPTIQCKHSHGPLVISGNTMSMTINNLSISSLTVKDVTVFWNSATGHTAGQTDKSLQLQSGSITSTFWNGAITAPSYTISTFLNPPLTIPIGSSKVTFTFKFSYDTLNGTERILINLSTPGCESYPIDSDIISNPN